MLHIILSSVKSGNSPRDFISTTLMTICETQFGSRFCCCYQADGGNSAWTKGQTQGLQLNSWSVLNSVCLANTHYLREPMLGFFLMHCSLLNICFHFPHLFREKRTLEVGKAMESNIGLWITKEMAMD